MCADDDKTDEPDVVDNVNQVGTGNTDGCFEPGASSPFHPDGSPRRTVAQARRGLAGYRAATIRDEDSRREAEAIRHEDVTSRRTDDLRGLILQQRPAEKVDE